LETHSTRLARPQLPNRPRRNSISLVVLVMEGTRSIEYMGGIILSVGGAARARLTGV
jgi:hypothetical protein